VTAARVEGSPASARSADVSAPERWAPRLPSAGHRTSAAWRRLWKKAVADFAHPSMFQPVYLGRIEID
jgi:hypothetical protein